jgi:hypothetical protein
MYKNELSSAERTDWGWELAAKWLNMFYSQLATITHHSLKIPLLIPGPDAATYTANYHIFSTATVVVTWTSLMVDMIVSTSS